MKADRKKHLCKYHHHHHVSKIKWMANEKQKKNPKSQKQCSYKNR